MPTNRRRAAVGALVVTLVLAVTAVVTAVVLSVPVVGDSMRPTLRHGDRVVVNILSTRPRRLDVVVLRFADGGPEVVKRVLALPGDRVAVEAHGVLVRSPDGPWLRVHNPAWTDRWERPEPPRELSLGDGELFVMGDNPDDSADSRTLGPAPQRLVRGTVPVRLFPLGDLGRVPRPASLQPVDGDR